MGRRNHAAVCVDYGGDHPQLLVTGGRDNANKILSDVWMLDLQSWKWKEVSIRGGSMCALTILLIYSSPLHNS